MHLCPDCGVEHEAPIVEETGEVADAAVEIAKIEARKEIKIAEINSGDNDRVRMLEAENAGLREALGRAEGALAMAPAGPEIVVVEEAPAEPEVVVDEGPEIEEMAPAPEPDEDETPRDRPRERKNVFFK